MVPPCDVSFKVSHQLIGGREGVRFLRGFSVPVIAFSVFVVIAQHALLFDHVRQAVLEKVQRGWNRLWNMPDHHFDERVGGDDYPASNQGYGLHVGDNTNT
jgi:hypothetical protein